jgi:hypothetical protein
MIEPKDCLPVPANVFVRGGTDGGPQSNWLYRHDYRKAALLAVRTKRVVKSEMIR